MDYQDTLKYLYDSTPMFQEIGAAAYKPGLGTMLKMDEHLGHPHTKFKTIHVGGTNGKGSCSHSIAAVLQAEGYSVGLFTSPHLFDFRERIRVNGQKITESFVIEFVEQNRALFEELHPSFFELTTAMAFSYFAKKEVDFAIIEVGMGGRLDSTNIISPVLSVITNISLDHTQFLGHTEEAIAHEKAGIIKPDTPVVIGRASGSVKEVFIQTAAQQQATIDFASEEMKELLHKRLSPSCYSSFRKEMSEMPLIAERAIELLQDRNKDSLFSQNMIFPDGVFYELTGAYQEENLLTILAAIQVLRRLGIVISQHSIQSGLVNVCSSTGLMGRWQKLSAQPDVICDTAHNPDAIKETMELLLKNFPKGTSGIHIVIGLSGDKDISNILELLPVEATYYFTRATVKRSLPEDELQKEAQKKGLKGDAYPTVAEAVKAAQANCPSHGVIYIGGSNFVVADLSNCDAFNFH